MKFIVAPFWLASRSPRRRQMLNEAGVPIEVHPADIDDGCLAPGNVPPEAWVMALAYLKARRVMELQTAQPGAGMDLGMGMGGTIIGADTVCVHDGKILGQPHHAAHAREMIRRMRHRAHFTITGVALLTRQGRSLDRRLFYDRARVTVGHIPDAEIDRYVASDQWRGKAGAYNLSERIEAGWPIEVEGDPATVMGLPMQRLLQLFANQPTEPSP